MVVIQQQPIHELKTETVCGRSNVSKPDTNSTVGAEEKTEGIQSVGMLVDVDDAYYSWVQCTVQGDIGGSQAIVDEICLWRQQQVQFLSKHEVIYDI